MRVDYKQLVLWDSIKLLRYVVDSSIVLVEIAHLLNINCPDLLPGINLDNRSGSLNGISIPIIPSVFNYYIFYW